MSEKDSPYDESTPNGIPITLSRKEYRSHEFFCPIKPKAQCRTLLLQILVQKPIILSVLVKKKNPHLKKCFPRTLRHRRLNPLAAMCLIYC